MPAFKNIASSTPGSGQCNGVACLLFQFTLWDACKPHLSGCSVHRWFGDFSVAQRGLEKVMEGGDINRSCCAVLAMLVLSSCHWFFLWICIAFYCVLECCFEDPLTCSMFIFRGFGNEFWLVWLSLWSVQLCIELLWFLFSFRCYPIANMRFRVIMAERMWNIHDKINKIPTPNPVAIFEGFHMFGQFRHYLQGTFCANLVVISV